MLDSVTKKRIDDLRNILVGKIPSPQSQVEQITTGLIYKFMYDMDNEALEMGGVPSFFIDEYEKYSWKHLFNTKLGGVEKVKLYTDAIENLYNNPHAPSIFREIFKNSFLPFKDPSTLNMFLKEINEFHYSDSEQLGDAYEYLLSFMGSQGDAGQFRTPRHIINFIIEIVKPKKNETILDPACGTSGFLISSYKYILSNNTEQRIGDKLNASERKKIGNNLIGYDIDPSMSRISLVNMYLHNFASPKISEYDTLSSEDKWNEYFDVILANPPFFSPTGGIKPHSRFGVKSKRAEVLFVDYIMEHLKPSGRAGIIVPEGIIFQNGNAYKTLRKKLVEDCLVGVISLPAGVFQPYSGVKTSILILDKELNQKAESIFFAKVKNDGFSLGSQRTPITNNDLPSIITNFSEFYEDKHDLNSPNIVSKWKILENSSHSLSANLYAFNQTIENDFEMISLGNLVDLKNGYAFSSRDYVESSKVMNFRMSQIRPGGSVDLTHNPKYLPAELASKHREYLLKEGDVVIAMTDMASDPKILGVPTIIPKSDLTLLMNQRVGKLFGLDNQRGTYQYIGWILKSEYARNYFKNLGTGGVQINISKKQILSIKIPLPPIEVQQQIVDELESYQKIIDGCRNVIYNYKPTFEIDPSWEMVELKEMAEFKRGPFGGSLKKEIFVDEGFLVYEQYHAINDDYTKNRYFINEEKFQEMSSFEVKEGDLIISCSGTMGKISIIPKNHKKGIINQALLRLRARKGVLNTFLKYYLESSTVQSRYFMDQNGAAIQNVGSVAFLKTIPFPKISIEVQEKLVKEIFLEENLILGNKKLIDIYSNKIQKVIGNVWGK